MHNDSQQYGITIGPMHTAWVWRHRPMLHSLFYDGDFSA